jgi:hypothetical protein
MQSVEQQEALMRLSFRVPGRPIIVGGEAVRYAIPEMLSG